MKKQVLDSIKWSALAEIASKILPPLFYVITARLLTPEDFGLVATSSMIIAFASILWETGLSKAFIQNQDKDNYQKIANIVFFTNIILSVLVYIILYVFSVSIALFFHDDRVSDVIKVSGLSLIIGSLMSVQTAIFQKNFEFKKLFYSRFIGAIIPGLVSIFLAYFGFGYWSLVYGSIVSLFLQALTLWKISPWRPSFEYDFKIAKKIFHFSKWVFISSLLSWFFLWGDIFILGYFFSSHEVGLYRTGNYFVSSVIGLITTPIVPVLYSYFSKIQNDKEKLKESLLFSTKVVSFFVLPIGFVLFIVRDLLSDLVFGMKWIGIAPVIGYLGLQQAFSWIVGLNGELYKAIGKPDIETKILFYSVFFYLTTYIITSNINFHVFLIGRLMLVFFGISVNFYFLNRSLNIDLNIFIKSIRFIITSLFLALLLSNLIKFFTTYILNNQNFIIIFSVFLFLISYLTFIIYFEKNFLKELYLRLLKGKH